MKNRYGYRNKARKILAWVFVYALCIVSAAPGGYAKEKIHRKESSKEEQERLKGGYQKEEKHRNEQEEPEAQPGQRAWKEHRMLETGVVQGMSEQQELQNVQEASKQQDVPEETDVMEVSDLSTLREAVDMVTTDEDLNLESPNPWQSKRLLVRSEFEFDTMGAEHVICGYEQLYILDYASEEEAKAACDHLENIPGLLVEAESIYRGTSEKSEALAQEFTEREATLSPAQGASENATDSRTVCVAVLDTGYDSSSYGTDRITGGTDIGITGTRTSDTKKADADAAWDENGHGTVMANIILNHTPDCVRIMPVKVADENGRTSSLKLYMGIRYAMENGANIINISMGALQTAGSQVVADAICQARQAGILTVVSAGNAGQDAASFSPADAKDAIAVAAVNADKSHMSYSNYGERVDYCSYGKLRVSGLNRQETEYSGTSVSAAIVSAVIAEEWAMGEEYSCEELIARLDGRAKDLGEAGRDIYFGKGLLSIEGMDPLEEADAETKLPELLTCDWQEISDDKLNALISESDELIVRRFLDLRSEEERNNVLKRAPVLQSDHVEIVCGMDGTKQYRTIDTLYKYLYSDRFDTYYVQKRISGTYYMYIQNATRKVYLTTNKDETRCTLKIKFSGTSTNPADNPTITVSGTSAGAFSLKNAKVDGVKTFTDDNGNRNTIGQVGVVGIEVKKRAHSKITGQKKAVDLIKNPGNGLWAGGFTGFGSNKCVDTASADCRLMVGIGDLELNKDNQVQTYRIHITNYEASGWGNWTDWNVLQNAFCYQAGTRQHTHTKVCSNCGKTANTETVTESIPQLAHNFTNVPWIYAINNGVADGERWLQCGYACGTAVGSSGYDVNHVFWKKDYQYLQRIFFRYMNIDGKYPEYKTLVNGYFPAGTQMEGFSYTETEYAEYKNTPGVAGYTVSNQANIIYVDVPRKKYTVTYDGNGAAQGSVKQQEVYCGQIFDLRENGFYREGYEFLGWSKNRDGAAMKDRGCKNLSFQDGAVVTLYAKWKAIPICITLDNQGANVDSGTKKVFEHYAVGYFENRELTNRFVGNRIQIPQKQRKDTSLPDGMRRQQFMGYFTEKGGGGHQAVKNNGYLVSDINGQGAYQYFKRDRTIYAHWQDMYAVQFDPNLTEQDLKLIHQEVLCPYTRWAKEGEKITVSFGKAVVKEEQFADIYRFLGWSLTPQITSMDEIVLSEEKPAYTFTAKNDVTLYAQWDTSFVVAYVGNEQSSGVDCTEKINAVTDMYKFYENDEENAEYYFSRNTLKPTVDIASGQMQNADGEPFMEQVPYRFLGWSMEKERSMQEMQEIYTAAEPGIAGDMMIVRAKEAGVLLFGRLPEDFGTYSTPYVSEDVPLDADVPVIALYAVWDQYPQIHAADLYVPLADARNGKLTEEYFLNHAKATDEEMELTSFTLLDYQAEEFTKATEEMGLTLTYRAEDKAENVTEKMIHVYLADTSPKQCNTGKVRFISEKYLDTLAADSVWRSGTYAETLAKALGNHKTGEEYTEVTPIQQALGVQSVKKPGSGRWNHVQEVWEFTHEQVMQIQEYVKSVGVGGDPSGFLEQFGHCRVQ